MHKLNVLAQTDYACKVSFSNKDSFLNAENYTCKSNFYFACYSPVYIYFHYTGYIKKSCLLAQIFRIHIP